MNKQELNQIRAGQLATLLQAQLLCINANPKRRHKFEGPELAKLLAECLEITDQIHNNDPAAIKCLREADSLLKTCNWYAANEPLWSRILHWPNRFLSRFFDEQ